ncbi:MAG: diguanylate cyclase, partial [Bacteroidota bacterium]
DTFSMLGNAQLVQGSWKEAEECFQGCLELTHRIGNRDEKIFAGINLSLSLLEQGEFAQSVSFADTACEEAEATGSKYALGSALAIRAFAAFQLGRWGEAIDGLAAALDIARDTSNRYLELFALVYRTEMLAQMGRWGEALDAGMMAKNLIQETQNREGELPLLATMAEVYSYFNEHELARTYLERAEKEAVERQMKGVLARILKAKAVWFGARGAWADAVREAHEALALAQETGARYLEGDAKWILGEAALAQGRREKAWQEYQGAQLLARTIESAGLELRALQGLARSDSRNGAIYKRQYRERLTSLLSTLAPTEQEIAGEAWEKYLLFKGGKQETPEELQEQVSQFIEQMTDFSTNLKEQVAEWASLKRSHKHLEQLVQFSLSIHQLHDLDEVLNRVVDLVVEITGSDRGFLLMYQDGQLQCHAMKNIRTDNALEWGVSEAIAKEVLLSEEPLCIYDAMNDARFSQQESVQSLHLRTVICVPLCIHEQTVGVIYVDRQSVNEQFSQADLDLLQSLAAQAANAIENAMLHTEWQDKSRKLEMLNTLSRTVSRTLVPQEVHELVIKLTLEVSDAERGFLFMLDEGHLRCKAGFDREGTPLTQEGSPISQSILQKVLSSHEPMIILDAMTDEELQYQASIMALNLRTVMCVPLTAKEETVGLIYVDSQAVRSFTQSDLDLLEAIASHASIAVENASLYGQLTERASELETMVRAYEEATLRASIDFLTGTYNRRHFIDTFRRDFAQSRRYRRSLALMMIDLDHFKSFNDTYGHPMGDRALQTVAQIIQQTVRAEDVVARYGGEEFIVGLPDTDLEGALIVAERIRAAVAEYPIEDARPVTVSIGTALCQTTDERIAELIERADQALYEAKKLGRNQVCVK